MCQQHKCTEQNVKQQGNKNIKNSTCKFIMNLIF